MYAMPEVSKQGRTYCVPTGPSHPPTPEDNIAKEVAGVEQQVDIGDDVEDQVDPLHSCLYKKKRCIAFSPRLPTSRASLW